MDLVGLGLGKSLFLQALRLLVAVSDQVGVRSLVVNPIDGEAAAFRTKFDFETLLF